MDLYFEEDLNFNPNQSLYKIGDSVSFYLDENLKTGIISKISNSLHHNIKSIFYQIIDIDYEDQFILIEEDKILSSINVNFVLIEILYNNSDILSYKNESFENCNFVLIV
jgi:hypothetical protein